MKRVVRDMKWSDETQYLVSSSWDNTIRVISIKTRCQNQQLGVFTGLDYNVPNVLLLFLLFCRFGL